MVRTEERNCLFCHACFVADARNARHQKYCSAPACRQESKAASRRAWLAKTENLDYFRGAENVARVKGAIGSATVDQAACCRLDCQ
jgi:hypothetical protein